MSAKAIKKMQNCFSYTGMEKAAIMLISLPDAQAQKVFSGLSLEEVRNISQVMANLGEINSQTIELLCGEFANEMSGSDSIVGTIESTRKLLSKLMSKEEVERIIGDICKPTDSDLWNKLSSIDERILAGYLKNESPQTVAVVLSRILPEASAKIISHLPDVMVDDVIMRILCMDNVRKEVLEDIENTLHREFIGTLGRSLKQDTYEIVAEVFNNLDRTAEMNFMSRLEQKNPEAAEKIRDLMFTFEDLVEMNKESIRAILRAVERSKLAMALKGTPDRIRQKFTENMSERSAKLLLDEMNILGLVRLKDVENAQNEMVMIAKNMAARREISILSNGETKEDLVE